MAEQPSEVVTRLQRMVADASAQQLELVQQYAGLFQKFLKGETNVVDPATAMQFWINEGTAYTQRLAEFSLRTYNELFELNRDLAERYLTLVTTTGGTSAKKAVAKPAAAASARSAPRKATKRARRSSATPK